MLKGLLKAERAAFDRIFELYYRQLCYFAFSIVQEMQLAEDLATESFIILWNKKPSFENTGKLKSYLFTLVYRASLNQLKAKERHHQSHQEIALNKETEEPVDLKIIRSEALQVIYQQIEALPPQCRQVIKGVFIEGKSVKEIAGEMNLAAQTVLNQKNRGIRLLRNALVNDQGLTPAVLLMACSFLARY